MHCPCKIPVGTGISLGSRQDSRRLPGSRRDRCRGGPFSRRDPSWEKFPPPISARIPPRNLYSPGSRQEKNSSPGSRQESCWEICTHRDPAKKKTLLQDPGENPAGKQNLDSIRGENLKFLPSKNSSTEIPAEKFYILIVETQIPAGVR